MGRKVIIGIIIGITCLAPLGFEVSGYENEGLAIFCWILCGMGVIAIILILAWPKLPWRLQREKDEYEEIDVTVIKVPPNTEFERQKRIKLGDETRKIKVPKKKNEV